MDQASFWVIGVIGPVILLIVLVLLVMGRRSNTSNSRTEAGTRELYRQEEERRREGTDEL